MQSAAAAVLLVVLAAGFGLLASRLDEIERVVSSVSSEVGSARDETDSVRSQVGPLTRR